MTEEIISLYKKRVKIHPLRSRGFFTNIRIFLYFSFLFFYFILPWIQYHGRQSVIFDLPSRKFYIFNITLWPQNFFILYYLIIILILSLLFFTVLVGRVWCGYACPQTIFVYVFMLIEEFVEGNRNHRIKMDKQKLSFDIFCKRLLKHFLWVLFSFFTSYTFVGYFTPIKNIIFDILNLSIGFTECFFILFFLFLIYFDAGWMREQVCFYMCPYARFQSVMFDKNTILVSYDSNRGEPRGSRRRGADYKKLNLGDCIDCNQCVNVCPTGIDIRNGLQLECIHCSSCIDKCNEVMSKMEYKKDLIKYTTENELDGNKSNILRPKLIMYFFILSVMIFIFIYSLLYRVPFDVNVTRDRGQLYRITMDDMIENTYLLKIINMSQVDKIYKIFIKGEESMIYTGEDIIKVDSNSSSSLNIQLQNKINYSDKYYNNIYFFVIDLEDFYCKNKIKTVFIGNIEKI